MENVLDEIALTKGRLQQALSRRGLAQARLNNVAQQIETFAKSLREDPMSVAQSFSPLDLTSVRALLDSYVVQDSDVSEHAKTLRVLRVPEAEIQALLA